MTDLNALLTLLREPGWTLVEQRLENATCVVRNDFAPRPGLGRVKPSLIASMATDDYVLFAVKRPNRNELEVRLKSDALRVNVDGEYPCHHSLSIYGPKVRREQVRQIDGGGWREVRYEGLLLRFRHEERYTAMNEFRKVVTALGQAEQALREQEAAAVQRRAPVTRRLKDLIAEIDGATVIGLAVEADGQRIRIRFSNGTDLDIGAERVTDGDPCSLRINGTPTHGCLGSVAISALRSPAP